MIIRSCFTVFREFGSIWKWKERQYGTKFWENYAEFKSPVSKIVQGDGQRGQWLLNFFPVAVPYDDLKFYASSLPQKHFLSFKIYYQKAISNILNLSTKDNPK
jgi:hypothetical protein